MWLTESLNQVNHIGENPTHHLGTMLELWRQRQTHQVMKMLQIKAKSSNVFERNGQPRSKAYMSHLQYQNEGEELIIEEDQTF